MRLRFLVMSLIAFVLLTGTGFSQTFTGLIDGYWSYNSNKPIVGGQRVNNYRAFDTRDQSFSLNYGELAVDYKPNNVGIRVDIGFGDTADAVHYNPADQNTWRHFQQAYLTLTHDKWTVDFGKFVTPIGAEVIETKDNMNYSRGLLFTLAIPFYHFGARATYAASDKVTLAAYIVNGWDNVRDNNKAKSVGIVGTFKPDSKTTIVTNYLMGRENAATQNARQLFDGTLTYAIHEKVTFMANYDFAWDKADKIAIGIAGPTQTWQGIAGYLKLQPIEKLTVTPRYEFFQDRNGARTKVAQEIQSATLTASVPWEDATLYAEYRRDMSNKSTFNTTSQGVFGPTQGLRDYQNTFLVGIGYTFTKEVK